MSLMSNKPKLPEPDAEAAGATVVVVDSLVVDVVPKVDDGVLVDAIVGMIRAIGMLCGVDCVEVVDETVEVGSPKAGKPIMARVVVDGVETIEVVGTVKVDVDCVEEVVGIGVDNVEIKSRNGKVGDRKVGVDVVNSKGTVKKEVVKAGDAVLV